jgi:hypothetical protein
MTENCQRQLVSVGDRHSPISVILSCVVLDKPRDEALEVEGHLLTGYSVRNSH